MARRTDVLQIRLEQTGDGKVKATLDGVSESLGDIDQQADRTTSTIKQLGTAIIGALSVREVVQYADAWKLARSQIRLVTDSTNELNAVQDELVDVARRTRSEYNATVELYARVARSSDELQLSQRELLEFTEAVNQTIQVSGATAAEANAGVIQFAQGLASGALRGDELRSVLEQMPRLARAIAEGMGITVGQLREMGEQGALTAETVVNAIQSQAEVINTEFAQIEPTISSAFEVASTNAQQFIGRLDTATTVTSGFADIIINASGSLDSISDDLIFGATNAAEFAAVMGASVATLDERWALLQNTVTGTLATIFRDEEVAEAAAAQRAVLEVELDKEMASIQEHLDEVRKTFEQTRKDLLNPPDVDLDKKKSGGIASGTGMPGTEEEVAIVARYWTQHSQGIDNTIPKWQRLEQDVVNFTDGVKDSEEAVKAVNSSARELGFTFQSAFEDAIFEGEGFRGVLGGIFEDIQKIILRRTVTEPLAGAVSGLLDGFSFTDMFKSFDLPSFDVGTPYVPHDMVAMVHKGEAIIPAAENARGGSGMTIHQTISIDARNSDISEAKLFEAAKRGAEAGYQMVMQDFSTNGPARQLVGT